MTGDYLPGYRPDAIRMLSARTAAERAGQLLSRLSAGMRVLDLGCGPGSITAGLVEPVAPHGIVVGADASLAQLGLARQLLCAPAGEVTIGLIAALAETLPVRTGAIDVVFAHAVFEHLAGPQVVLAELRRVLRPGGLLALSSSDWSAAVIEPRTAAVDRALHAYWRLRQRTGTDPFAGGRLADQVREAGFTVLATIDTGRVDMGYSELAGYLHDRLARAADDTEDTDVAAELAEGARAAAEWTRTEPGRFVQCWVDVLATPTPAGTPHS